MQVWANAFTMSDEPGYQKEPGWPCLLVKSASWMNGFGFYGTNHGKIRCMCSRSVIPAQTQKHATKKGIPAFSVSNTRHIQKPGPWVRFTSFFFRVSTAFLVLAEADDSGRFYTSEWDKFFVEAQLNLKTWMCLHCTVGLASNRSTRDAEVLVPMHRRSTACIV